MIKLPPTDRFQLNMNISGVILACLYSLLAPIMIQNSFAPLLPGRWGHLQIADFLAPLMACWLILSLIFIPVVQDKRFKVLLSVAAVYIMVGPLSGILTEGQIPIADTLKRSYVVLTLIFFYRVYHIENASFIMLWTTIYILIIFIGLSIIAYIAYLFTGASNVFVKISGSIFFDQATGLILGPMRPTEKLFATYLFLLAAMIFLNTNLIKRPARICIIGLIFICAVLTGSRPGAITAIGIILSIAILNRHRITWLALLSIPTLIVLIVIETSAIWDFNKLIIGIENGYNLQNSITLTTSFYLKKIAWLAWLDNPLLGIGPENFTYAWIEATRQGVVPTRFATTIPKTPVSTYFQLLTDTGIIGLLSWLSLFVTMIYYESKEFQAVPNRRNLTLIWVLLLCLIMINISIINFRFIYCMIPLAIILPIRNPEIPPQSDL